jgi:ubiquitin conjugation factor E4 B
MRQFDFYSQTLLHKVVHGILSNVASREKCIQFLAEVLRRNSGRTKIQGDRRENTSDGPMLNYLSVCQLLSLKVRLDKIDSYYPFHPNSVVDLKSDTRINSSSAELEEWVQSLGKFSPLFQSKWDWPYFRWFL